MTSPRIGCVKYLNARPLIYGWPGEVVFDHPSYLCRQLAAGALDLALVSSFELLRNPIYTIVDDVSISSDGAVHSVVVAHREELSRVQQIELDPASETSVHLLRFLLAQRGLTPRLIPRDELEKRVEQERLGSAGCQPVVAGSLPATFPDAANAQLLIGDQAIRFRQFHPEYRFWDLGEEWSTTVDLPFVYAIWLVRPEVTDAKAVANRLRALRDENLAKIDQLVAQEKEFDHAFCRRYYRRNLRFNFGEREKHGLQTFADVCAQHRLILKRELEFDLV